MEKTSIELNQITTQSKLNKILSTTQNTNLKQILTYTNQYIYDSKDFKEIEKNLKQLGINPSELGNTILNNFFINIDYDDVMVDLLGGVLKWFEEKYHQEHNYKKITLEQLIHYFIFEDFQKEFNAYANNKIQIFDFFDDPMGYEKYVFPKLEAQKFIDKLHNHGFKNFYILTSTFPEAIIHKHNHIQKHFSISPNKVIYAKDKTNININFGIHIDDAIHNVEAIVKTNPFCHTFLIDMPHNKQCETEKRILRIQNKGEALEEVFNKIPLVATKTLLRLTRKDLLLENIMPLNNTKQTKTTKRNI